MKNITTLSSFFLIGTTLSLLLSNLLQSTKTVNDEPEEDFPLYL